MLELSRTNYEKKNCKIRSFWEFESELVLSMPLRDLLLAKCLLGEKN